MVKVTGFSNTTTHIKLISFYHNDSSYTKEALETTKIHSIAGKIDNHTYLMTKGLFSE